MERQRDNCYDKLISTHWCLRGTGSFMQTYFCKPTPLPMQSLSSIPPDQVEDSPCILSWQIMMMKYFESRCLILKMMMWWSHYWMLKVMDMTMNQPMLQESMYDVNLTSLFWSQHAWSIEYYLQMVVENGQKMIDASECAAKSEGFTPQWGGWLVWSWVHDWLKHLSKSKQGQHVKVASFLGDPEICVELRSYLRTNKWVMNPQKLVKFTKGKLLPIEVKKYLLLEYIPTSAPNRGEGDAKRT